MKSVTIPAVGAAFVLAILGPHVLAQGASEPPFSLPPDLLAHSVFDSDTQSTGDAWIAVNDDQSDGIQLLPEPQNPSANPFIFESVPATLTVRSGDRVSLPFQLRNTGGVAAGWQLRVVDGNGTSGSLDELLDNMIRRSPELLASLPGHIDFEGGVTGTRIDGTPFSGAPFSGGNILETSLGGPLDYSDGQILTSSALGAAGRYFTLKLPGLFLFAGDLDGPEWFDAGGQASRASTPAPFSFRIAHGGHDWQAFAVKRDAGPFGPAVNQLFLVNDPDATQDVETRYSTTVLDAQVNLSGKRRICYASFVVATNASVDPEAFHALARSLIGLMSEVPAGVTVVPAAGSLAAGAAAASTLAVDAFRLLPGGYPLAIDVQPTGGGAEVVRTAVTLNVEEPAIRFAVDSIDHAGIFNGPTDVVEVATDSTSGGERGWTARIVGGGTWVTLLTSSGTTPDGPRLRFNPSSGVGLFQAVLEVSSGSASYQLPIFYAVDTLSPVAVTTDPLRPVAYALNRTYYGGAVVVIDPVYGTVKKVIRVGRGASDLAFSPDGSEIYVLSTIDMEINRIDPVTKEVTGTLQVPGTTSSSILRGGWPMERLVVGANGRVFYTDGGSYPTLRLLDFSTGQVLATLGGGDIPEAKGQSTGFGDLFLDSHADRLYFTRRNSSTGYPRIGLVNVSGDQLTFESEWTAENANSTVVGSARILSDLNGKAFYVDRQRYDRTDPITGSKVYENWLCDVSAYGELVMTQYAIHDALTGQKLADRPAGGNEVAAFTQSQAGVTYWANGKFNFWALPSSIRPQRFGIRPDPANGDAIELGQDILRWSALPLVDGYRIYLGTDAAVVAAAQPGSPEDKGIVTTNSYTLDPVPTSGRFFWRIDAVRGETVTVGSVSSFTIAPFQVTPDQIDVTAPMAARPQRVVLKALDGDGNPIMWNVSSSNSWIKFPKTTGSADDSLIVDLDPVGLTEGSHSGSVRVTGAGFAIDIPVTLRLFKPDLHRLCPDPNRSIVYGLQTGVFREQPGTIVSIDAATGVYLASFALDKYATACSVHPIEDRLYVPLPHDGRIQVFDLATGEELSSIAFPEAYAVGDVTPGRAGRIFVEYAPNSSSWALCQIDTETGENLGNVDKGYASRNGYGNGTGASDPTGHFLYRESGGQVQRTDVSTDEAVLLETGTSSSSPADGGGFSSLAVSRDGSRVLSNRTIMDAKLRRIASIESNGQSITGDGQIVAGASAIYWADTGFKIADLPVSVPEYYLSGMRAVFSSDDRHIVIWDDYNQRVRSIPLDSLVDLPGPMPRPGQQLTGQPDSLAWSAVDGATGYRVFLGTSESAVGAAGLASVLLHGSPDTNTLALSNPLAPGFRYFWRVDAVTPTGVVKGAVVFFDLPFPSNGNPIIRPAGATASSGSFGRTLATSPDGLLVGEGNRAMRFDFDFTSGEHQLGQTITGSGTSNTSGFGDTIAAGPGLAVIGDPEFNEPVANSGGVFIHRPFPGGKWYRTASLPDVPDGLVSAFGNQVAFDANQLLIQQGTNWLGSGKVYPYFEWPTWRRGPELVPVPRETNDFFGAAIALDGTRALIGAPGSGSLYDRKGSGFIFEYNPGRKEWRQMARLLPSQGNNEDFAGMSVALAGDHAVLGSGNHTSIFNKTAKVHIFNRRSSGTWPQAATLVDPAPNDYSAYGSRFGQALAIDGDLLFVSAPYAEWRGEGGGVVYPYRFTGSTWEPLAPLVPPPGGSEFGAALAIHDGWLFVTQYQETSSKVADQILVYRIDEAANREPQFVTAPPFQVVGGKATGIPVAVADPDGNQGLVFGSANLPAGLILEDLGNGRATISGTPTDPVGAELWIRIPVADPQGAQAVQTALVKILASDDLPVPDDLPVALDLEEGEDLVLAPTIGGSGPFSWQWQRDGTDIPGAVGPSLLIPATEFNDSGSYRVIVSNVVGTVTSGEVAVTVRQADRFAGDWASFGSSSDRDGYQAATLGLHTFQPVWEAQAQDGYGLNPVAVAEGRVFVTPRNYHGVMEARAYNLVTGDLQWSHEFTSAHMLTSPTWHDGRIYLQRGNSSSDSQVWCLDAATGAAQWSAPYSTQFSVYEAPAVSELGVFTGGGSGSGIYGHNFDGSQRFFRILPPYGMCAPTISQGRLYTWVEGKFIEHDPQSGSAIWKLDKDWDWNGWSVNTVPVVKGPRAYLLSNSATICIDTEARQVVWEVPQSFRGTPALAGGRLFVLSGTAVRALSTVDGSEVGVYQTTTPTNQSLIGQPLVLNDYLVASTETNTFVFNIESTELVQTIPHGGYPAYSGNYLLLAGTDGVLRAFAALNANAWLADLELTSGLLVPAFAREKSDYSATLPYKSTVVTVNAVKEDPASAVLVNGRSPSVPVDLAVGNNTLSTLVTAEDGFTTRTYTVTLTRLPENFVFNSGSDVPVTANGFVAGGFPVHVKLNHAQMPGTVLTMVNNTGPGFIHGRFGNLAQGQGVSLTYGGKDYDFVANYFGGTGNDLVLQWAATKALAWGSNNYGQLGDNGTSGSLVPGEVDGAGVLSGKVITAVSGGYLHSLALCSDGVIASWGYNAHGQLGNGGTDQSRVPVEVDRSGVLTGKTVIAVSAGPFHNLALCSDGTVAAWGYNNYGQLGSGDTVTSRVPVLVSPVAALAGKNVVAVAAGAYHSFALCDDGTVAGWGYNDEGELGDGTTTGSLVPVAVDVSGVLAGKRVSSISAGQYHALALCTDGTLAAWGYNNRGQLGDGTTTTSGVPVGIGSNGVLAGKVVVSVVASNTHSLAMCADGTVAAWGYNHRGQLGAGGTVGSELPVAVDSSGFPPGVTAVGICAGSGHSMLRFNDGSLATWGDNAKGQLGDNGISPRELPGAVDMGSLDADSRFVMMVASGSAASHNLAVMALPELDDAARAAWLEGGISHGGVFVDDLIAYAFGIEPGEDTTGKLPQLQKIAGRYGVSFSQPAGVSGIVYGAEWSATLLPGSWIDVPDTGSGADHVFTPPENAGPRVFMRLKVVRP